MATRLAEATAIPISYSRVGEFGTESSSIDATRGSTPFEALSDDGIITRIESRDYLTSGATFPFGLPESGDLITDGEDQYEVQALGGSRPYRYSDPGRALLRIHTKRIGVPE